MITGRERVWAALRSKPLERPPKGELLIDNNLVKIFSCNDLESVLLLLKMDLVTFPIFPTTRDFSWMTWTKKGYFTFGLFQGPFTLMCKKLGWNQICRIIVKNPGEAQEIMNSLIKDNIPKLILALEKGCEGIVFADDLAGNKGLLVSPIFLKENYFPLLEHMLQKLEFKKVPFIFHSDGNILDLVRPLKQIGFWGIQGLQPSAGIRPDSFGPDFQKWVFWGNFEFEKSHGLKNPQETETEVLRLLNEWSIFPGYIFGSSGGLYQDLDPEAIKAAYGAAWKHTIKD